MTNEQPTFEDLLREAPTAGTVSLVGAIERSSDAAKFVLKLPNGAAVTLDTGSVKGYAILDRSHGQIMVRLDIDAAKTPWLGRFESVPQPWVASSGVTPFSLAAPRQAPEIVIKSPVLDGGKTDPYLPDLKNAEDNTGLADIFMSHTLADLPT
jgi:hypothetical protein